MIKTIGMTEDKKLLTDFPLAELHNYAFEWYWVDIGQPDEEEKNLLDSFFHFHPLAIEDSLFRLQRPKLDFYSDYAFFVLHSICDDNLNPEELNLFLGSNYVVTFHVTHIKELDTAREKLTKAAEQENQNPVTVTHQIIDNVVDAYFPVIYSLEELVNKIEDQLAPGAAHFSMDALFDIRSDLLRLRRTLLPMRELLYRIINTDRLGFSFNEKAYFSDVYDNLLRLVDSLESNRELTADLRDSQLTINSNQMNRVMMTLTIISSIFIPLTFIAGVYGMNFEYMPELTKDYAYPVVLLVMLLTGFAMIYWFKRKGWLDIFRA